MDVAIGICLFVFGAALGSFAMAQVWRLRARQVGSVGKLQKEKRAKLGEWRTDRSICLHCGYQLKWYDNIPIISWVALRGKCRRCKAKIGVAEILMEVGLGLVFAASYFLWPAAGLGIEGGSWWKWAEFGVFLIMLVGMAILFVYDSKWGRLPEKPLTFCIICAILFASLRIGWLFSVGQNISGGWEVIWSTVGALVILPGLYFALYKTSKEKIVGSGDWLLAMPIALVLGDWWLAFWCLFISNALGSLVMIPMAVKGKKIRETMHISFGPFMIVGFLIVFFAQEWLLRLLFGLGF